MGDQPQPRGAIIDLLHEIHQSNGGDFKDPGHLLGAVKKALITGKAKGVLVNPRTGYYLRTGTAATPTQVDEEPRLGPAADGFEAAVGKGTGGVYVWYLPAYRERAKAARSDVWECKVGMSAYSAARRVAEQGYAPEQPVRALLIRTDDQRDLERHLHSALDGKSRRVVGAVGNEWFFTNPAEVLSLARGTRWVDER
ncbi:GIY-YIG nuclease family protein [Streptomyces virginiae]|uniref:GIY-YIG nuclease family protein n=1 Tax=Streptomyces virginiae TaxID=1961 RepID=UPI00365242AE